MRQLVLVTVLSLVAAHALAATPHDIAILNGRVMDPASGLDAVRHVGIRDGKVAAISSKELEGRRVIDATGLVVAPGFIDLHQHAQEPASYRYQARDGVTTSLELEVGTATVDRWYAEREGKALINFGVSAGHIPARIQVMKDPGTLLPSGAAASRGATADELGRIVAVVRQGLDEGALAVGMGINYTRAASHLEVWEVFRAAAKHGAPVHAHLRYLGAKEPETGFAALQEVIAASATTGAALHVVHVTSMGLGETPLLMRMIRDAQARGLDVTTECYPYAAASTNLESALFEPGWQERMGIGYENVKWARTGESLTAETFARYRKEGGQVVIFMIPEEVVLAAVADPMVMIASDGVPFGAAKVHPRGQGSFTRVLGHYVREKKALDLMTALRKMTLMPAQRLEKHAPVFKSKGRVQVGADADLTLFDPDRVIDRATFAEPLRYAEGVEFVLVNGVPVVSEGVLIENVFPGRAARGAIAQPAR